MLDSGRSGSERSFVMIVEKRILNFEKLGFGMFIHYGLYSLLGEGEWVRNIHRIDRETYDRLTERFTAERFDAEEIASFAKSIGCRYITLTTRHHDGFSLYDTCGLNPYDAPHSAAKRDLIAEYVAACRKYDIVPMFYHTTLDWREENFEKDFPKYLEYLRKSVEILCTRYGKIGGFWFDGNWSQSKYSWEEDALYGMIRHYQPDAMIINNTGLSEQGALGHPELDSVTFERGNPFPINQEGAPKYIASEMCQILCDHWGYAENDLNYKSMKEIIENFADCRKCGANFLLNIGLKGDGSIPEYQRVMLQTLGKWVKIYGEALYEARPMGQECRDAFLLRGPQADYLFVKNLNMSGDDNVTLDKKSPHWFSFGYDRPIRSVRWLDNGKNVVYRQEGDRLEVTANDFFYGTSLVVRVARIEHD